MNRAPSPRARPAASWIAILVALGLIVLAGVAVRDALVDQGLVEGELWLPQALTPFDGLQATNTVLWIAIGLFVLGLVLTFIALKPARYTHVRSSGSPSVWISRSAIEGSARDAAGHTQGVASVSEVSASKSKVTVSVNTTADTQTVAAEVKNEVAERLQGLSAAKIVVRTRREST